MNDDHPNHDTLIDSSLLSLRQVMEEDGSLLWKWANEPTVRAVSFSSQPISWSQHLEWFNRKLKDLNCYFFIAIDRDKIPIGQIRFDREEEDSAVISITIAPEKRGFGYGSLAINLAVNEIFHKTYIHQIVALIKSENLASIRVFEKIGFQNAGTIFVQGCLALKYVKYKN
jgi:UDP-2,4-diacetamido-2,4,6-trideoxy-beta-L-altropyranose hydrolase